MSENSNPPTIHVVTPSFNQAQFLRQTIDSVLTQEGPINYIVMDGGSTDDTKKILKSYGKEIEWVSEKDNGQTHAINKGIQKILSQAADDDIVAYINSDDYYEATSFSRVRSAFSSPSIHWIVGDAAIVDENGNRIQEFVRMYKKLFRTVFIPWTLFVLNPIPQPAVFLRVSTVKKIGLFNEQLQFAMDYEYWLRVFTQFGSPVFLDETLTNFRIHGTSKGTTAFHTQFTEEVEVASRFTRSKLLLLFHKLHSNCIRLVYTGIK